jgi:hypothetical protein
MMKATELRLGNIIQDTRHPKRECTIFRLTCGIDFSITYHYDKSKELSYSKENSDALQPVTLTKEWLLRLDFNLVEESPFPLIKLPYYVKNGICLFFNESPPENTWLIGWADKRFDNGYQVTTGRWIHYVHELQNIHFAITGNELTF